MLAGLYSALLPPLIAQIEPLLGLDAGNWFETRGSVQPLTAFVGPTTIAAMLSARRVTTRLPTRIVGLAGGAAQADAFPLHKFDLLAGLDREQTAVIARHLTPVRFDAGAVVFEEGNEGFGAFLIIKGVASVTLHQLDRQRPIRLVTFSPGTVFGGMALLDGEPRSATVVADTDLKCLALSSADFERTKEQYPYVAIQLQSNLASESSLRLRRANRLIFELEH